MEGVTVLRVPMLPALRAQVEEAADAEGMLPEAFAIRALRLLLGLDRIDRWRLEEVARQMRDGVPAHVVVPLTLYQADLLRDAAVAARASESFTAARAIAVWAVLSPAGRERLIAFAAALVADEAEEGDR